MPMRFTDEMVAERAEYFKIDPSLPDLRQKVADATIKEFGDVVEAWEIETGRPWNEMTGIEAVKLIEKHPKAGRNPGVLSRLTAR